MPIEDDARHRLATLGYAARARPTETQVELRQFSTPLPYARVAATAAAIRPRDVVLDSSTDTGAHGRLRRDKIVLRVRSVPRRVPASPSRPAPDGE